MKVVLDSNVLLVSLGRKSRYKQIWEAFTNGRFQLIISDEIVYEYQEILQRHSAPGIADAIMEVFIESPDIILQQLYYKWDIIKEDPDDNKFFDIAVAANADYLVTDDGHFNKAKQSVFPSVRIISSVDFLNILRTAM
jgi:putative PIN family toxin of toxin-antitoxin system